MKRNIFYASIAVLALSCSTKKQKPCIQLTAIFTDTAASSADKDQTAETIRLRYMSRDVDADVKRDSNKIIIKLPCNMPKKTDRMLSSDQFGIYEAYSLYDLAKYFQAINYRGELLNIAQPQGATPFGYCRAEDWPKLLKLLQPDSGRSEKPDDLAFYTKPAERKTIQEPDSVAIYAVKLPLHYKAVSAGMFKDAFAKESPVGKKYDVNLIFKEEYIGLFTDLTGRNIEKSLVMVSGNTVLMSALVKEEITGGSLTISGDWDTEEAEEMATNIKFSLPLKVVISEETMIKQ